MLDMSPMSAARTVSASYPESLPYEIKDFVERTERGLINFFDNGITMNTVVLSLSLSTFNIGTAMLSGIKVSCYFQLPATPSQFLYRYTRVIR